LAIEHGSTGRCLPPDTLPVRHDEEVVHALEQARVAPERKPALDGGSRWEILRDQTPCNAAAQNIKYPVDDLPQRPCTRSSKPTGLRHQRLDQSPFGIG
jgi:hypothetical protein